MNLTKGQKVKVIEDKGCNFEIGQIVTFVGEHYSRKDLLSFEGESKHDGRITTQLLYANEIEVLSNEGGF